MRLLCGVLLVLTLFALAARARAVENGSFETRAPGGWPGWRTGGEVEPAETGNPAPDAWCARLLARRRRPAWVETEAAARPDTNLALRLRLCGDLGRSGEALLEIQDVSGRRARILMTRTLLHLEGEWRDLVVPFANPKGTRLRLRLTLWGREAHLKIDTVSIGAPPIRPRPRRLAFNEAARNFPLERPVRVRAALGGARERLLTRLKGLFLQRVPDRTGAPWSWVKAEKELLQVLDLSPEVADGVAEAREPELWLVLALPGSPEAKRLEAMGLPVPAGNGGYRLDVSCERLLLAAADEAGLANGLATLDQLVIGTEDATHVMSVSGTDWPQTGVRGVFLRFSGVYDDGTRSLVRTFAHLKLTHAFVRGAALYGLDDVAIGHDARSLFDDLRVHRIEPVPCPGTLGDAAGLVNRAPGCLEAEFVRDESHYLRGREWSRLGRSHVVTTRAAPIEVRGDFGSRYCGEKDCEFRLDGAYRWLRRRAGGAIRDGGHVLVSYNAAPSEVRSSSNAGSGANACPREPESARTFGACAAECREGLGAEAIHLGCLSPLLARDSRCIRCALRPPRIAADYVVSLAKAADEAGYRGRLYVWADLLSPQSLRAVGASDVSESAELVPDALRPRLTTLLRIAGSDERARGAMRTGAEGLRKLGYRVVACAQDLAAAGAWSEETAAGRANAAGLVLLLPDGMEPETLARFADFAWHGPGE